MSVSALLPALVAPWIAAQLMPPTTPGDPTLEQQQHAGALVTTSMQAWQALKELSEKERASDGCSKDSDCVARAIAVGCDHVVLALGPRAAKSETFARALKELTAPLGPAPECERPSEIPLPVCRVVEKRRQCAFVDVDFRSDIVSQKEQAPMRWMIAQANGEVMKTTWLAGPVARRLHMTSTSAALTPERAAQLQKCIGSDERNGQITLAWAKSYQPHIQVLGDEITQVNNTLQVRTETRPWINDEQKQCLHRTARAWPISDSAQIEIRIGWY